VAVSNALGAFTYSWLPDANLLQTLTFPSGAACSNSYNPVGWLAERRNLQEGGGVVSTFTYAHDAVGLRTNVLFANGSGYGYTYDSVRQLISAHGYSSGGAADPSRQFGYTYDPAGNRIGSTNNGQPTAYRTSLLNQYTLTVAGSGPLVTNTFSYDASGNLTNETSPAGPVARAWDQENRLIMATQGDHRSEFVYNGLGQLVESREYENNVLQQSIRRVYDGALTAADLDGANTPLRTYVRGLDLSLAFEGAGGIGGLLALVDSQASMAAYYLSDGQGNVVDLVTPSGLAAAHYEYDPYGEVLALNGPLAAQPFQWSSKETHGPSNLRYYGQRFLRPAWGRWLARDPQAELGAALMLGVADSPDSEVYWSGGVEPSPYLYARNNPAQYWDAFGLACANVCGGAKSQGLDNGDLAGVICCGGNKYSCVWGTGSATGASNKKAVAISKACAAEHENDHHDDIDCPKNDCDKLSRSPFKPGKDPAAEEKNAYKVECACYKKRLPDCGKDAACKQQVEKERDYVCKLAK
jgi:RHS repeat-associated protein